MARGRRGPKHGDAAGKPPAPDPVETPEDVEKQIEAARKREFSPIEAMEITTEGAVIAARLSVLLKKQATLRKKLSDVGESIHTLEKDIVGLWVDKKSGQGRLDFADAPKTLAAVGEEEQAKSKAAAADVYVATYKGRRLSVTREPDGKWTARCATGANTENVGLTGEHAERTAAIEHALTMAGFDTKDDRPKWIAGRKPYEGPTRYTAKHKDRDLVAQRLEDGKWSASIGTDKIGVFDDAGAAMRFACSESKIAPNLVGLVEWEEDSVNAKGLYAKNVRTDEIEESRVEWGARVGGKACVLRQEEPGRWWARIGDVPIAQGLSLEKSKRLAEIELRKGAPEGTKIEWIRTITEDALPVKKTARS